MIAAAALGPAGASPFPPAEERGRHFADRDKPEQVTAVATDFLNLINFDIPMRGTGPRAPLAEVAKLSKENHPVEALGALYEEIIFRGLRPVRGIGNTSTAPKATPLLARNKSLRRTGSSTSLPTSASSTISLPNSPPYCSPR